MHAARWWREFSALALCCAIGSLAIAASNETQPGYRIGRGIADITGPPIGVQMLGYVRPEQIAEGIHLRQWSRAFIVAEPKSNRRLAIVTTDLQSVTHSMFLSVLDKLRERYADTYRADNVVIAATHTHAVPGGYWHYGANTVLGTPFHKQHYDALVEGIAASIVGAHDDLKPGRILIAEGEVTGAGAQRSRVAYLQNSESERNKYKSDTDAEMTLLKFVVADEPIGILNWFPVHPTSMSYRNRLISGDNKGYAEYAFERAENSRGGRQGPFVAAFAQSNCGDVTPNLNLNQTGPGKDDFESTRIIGERQAAAARRLFDAASEELAGPLDSRQAYVDFGQVTVRDEFTGAGDKTTAPSAYGYSFAAGSSEDGGGQPLFQEGMKQQSPLIDTAAKALRPLPPPSEALRRGHLPKPILFAPGAANPPLQPQVLPIAVARIGQLALVIGPAEFTTMSGRRFRETIKRAMPDVKYVVISGYANDYASYVATREEYEVQHYEGASTLFGPWTQAAYQQEYARLAADLAAGRPSATAPAPPDVRGTVRPTPLESPNDIAPEGAKFGDVVEDAKPEYRAGDVATVSFWTGDPLNAYKPDRRFAAIERLDGGTWRAIARDGDWDVQCRWSQGLPARIVAPNGASAATNHPPLPTRPLGKRGLAPYLSTVEWRVPSDAPSGTYRITHYGIYKPEADGKIVEFESRSREFTVP